MIFGTSSTKNWGIIGSVVDADRVVYLSFDSTASYSYMLLSNWCTSCVEKIIDVLHCLFPVDNFLPTKEAVEHMYYAGAAPDGHATSGAPISHFGSTRITMIHNSASHRIFKISELARLIAGQIVSIDRRTIVNLVCVCRYLEEPVLSTLWETQSSLCNLLRVLPKETWSHRYMGPCKCLVRSPDLPLEKSNDQV